MAHLVYIKAKNLKKFNYASFAVAYIRGEMEGQDPTLDYLNKPKNVD